MTPLSEQVMNKLEDLVSLIPSTEVEGETVSLTDCAGVRPIDVKIKGSLYQESYRYFNGNNIFDPSGITYPFTAPNGLTIDLEEDNTIVINGTATGVYNINFSVAYNAETVSEIFDGKTFTIVAIVSGFTDNGENIHNIGLKYSGNSDRITITDIGEDGTYYKTSVYTKQTTDIGNVYFTIFIGDEGSIFTDYKIKLMCYEGEYDENIEYEAYSGETVSPSPDYPQEIEVLTGDTTIIINDTDYQLSLGDIKLCGDSTYGYDYLFKYVGKWYKHQIWDSVILNGSENWNGGVQNIYNPDYYYFYSECIDDLITAEDVSHGYCDKFLNRKNVMLQTTPTHNDICSIGGASRSRVRFMINKSRLSGITTSTAENINTFKSWLSENNVTCYYVLAAPVDTEITDSTLISQLEKLSNAKLTKNNTAISTDNDRCIIDLTYFKDIETLLNAE